MLDVSEKPRTLRTASARARLHLHVETLARVHAGIIPKGNPLEVAKVAAVQAAKQTSTIIPYCHPLPIDYVRVDYEFGEDWIDCIVLVKTTYRTGVEMEAMTAASVAVLTLYDMMKMLDADMSIGSVTLEKKKGGKNDFRTFFSTPLHAAVLVMSDSISSGRKTDTSGRIIVDRLVEEGVEVDEYRIIPDDREEIIRVLRSFADDSRLDLVMTTGGTGFSPRDCTPEAMAEVIDRPAPGISEAARAYGQERTPYSMLSRAQAGLRGETLIVNLPGSRKGVADSLDALFPALLHSFKMIRRGGHE